VQLFGKLPPELENKSKMEELEEKDLPLDETL